MPVINNKCIASRLYLDYSTYRKIKKPSKYKTFYVTRDSRDIVVSWYYSSRYSHPLNYILVEVREKLNNMNKDDGIIFSIRHLCKGGAFDAQRSWVDLSEKEHLIQIFKFEQLVENELNNFKAIFYHCDINMPEKVFHSLIADHNFKKIAKDDGGTEDVRSHFRKGIVGDWENHFTNKTVELFKELTDDLLVKQDYESNINWTL